MPMSIPTAGWRMRGWWRSMPGMRPTGVRKSTRGQNAPAPLNGAWDITILPEGGKEQTIRAKALVNAAGPWVSEVLGSIVGRNNPDRIRMVKGSHIVVDLGASALPFPMNRISP